MAQPPITVHKFGGAALADLHAFRHAAAIIATHGGEHPVIVVSAMRGVTDALGIAASSPPARARATLASLESRHRAVATGLTRDGSARAALYATIANVFKDATKICAGRRTGALEAAQLDFVMSRGEILAAALFVAALEQRELKAIGIDATKLVYTDGIAGSAAPDVAKTTAAAATLLLPRVKKGFIPVVPGFFGRGRKGAVVTLGRGGTDVTATLMARVLHAHTVMLWKDVPGLLTADPRVVPDARLIPSLHVREASELAYHGAKILHPRALIGLPANTRLFLRPLADPTAMGTEISAFATAGVTKRGMPALPVKALAVISDQALVTIVGNGMAGLPGVAARALGALEQMGISVSLISMASSEHSLCIAVPGSMATAVATRWKDVFSAEIARRDIERVEVRRKVATLAIVGLGMAGTPGVSARLFDALALSRINVVAIAQGASEMNISVVIDERAAAQAQRAVHAAFRLDKIGGGDAGTRQHADVIVLGFGLIGRELALQLARRRTPDGGRLTAPVRVVAVIDRSGYVFDPRGLTPKKLMALAEAKAAGRPLAQQADGVRATDEVALRAIATHALERPIVVDVTASETSPTLEVAIAAGMDLVLANKRPLVTSGRNGKGLAKLAASRGRRMLHEATVGAGLPVIDTINKLVASGDRILQIEGCPSGTLGFLFSEMSRGTQFSIALQSAMAKGYTEPDPRDDLSGMDVARKALILGRLLGYTGELRDIKVESLVPVPMRKLPLADFLTRAGELDVEWSERVREAQARGEVLRYRIIVTNRTVRVGVVAVDASSPLGSLGGTDNLFSFTTTRYQTNPLVITGPGAGAGVTAAGVFTDVLTLAEQR
ncbi:MAG: aspartate kinase [Gemmatimonadaceae bacterium]|nr:aspartate kinase [Gemmatimonadaceae bacterium]